MPVTNKQTIAIKTCSGVVTALFIFLIIIKVFEAGSSTGGIWFIFLPLYGLVAYLVTNYFLRSFIKIKNCSASRVLTLKTRITEIYLPTLIILFVMLCVLCTAYSYYLSGRAGDPVLSEAELRDIYYGTWARYDKNVVLELASNQALSPEFLTEITIASAVDLNNDVSGGLRALFRGDSRTIAERIALHKNVPVSLLEKWGVNSIYRLRKAVAGNVKTPISVLDILSKDQYSIIRGIVASNSNTSIATLSRLANDTDQYVKNAVAMNVNLPISVLKQLLDDKDQSVARQAKVTLDRRNIGNDDSE